VTAGAPRSDLELVQWALGNVELGVPVDLSRMFEQEGIIERLGTTLAPDASIEFATPYGGFMGEMAGPFQGLDGLQRAWREWTAPWEAWTFKGSEWIDVGEGRVLLLGHSTGRFRGSGAEMDAPVAALYTVEGGMIVRIQHFLDQDQARRAAGLA